MNKKTIAFFKEKYPRAFAAVVRSPILSRIALELDRGNYLYCMLANRPYFGTIAMAGQTWDERKSWMTQLAEQEVRRKGGGFFYLLEVGSWAGDSAVLWANAIKSAGGRGMVMCVDAWTPYLKTQEREMVNAAPILMDRLLKSDKIFRLFLHNIRASGHTGTIIPVKGSSAEILPLLQEEQFDMIFLDADHSYPAVKRDLELSARLICDGGILCGDDFDLTADQIDMDYARCNRDVNMVIDPRTGRAYHPGVVLAVTEFFKQDISVYDGFWAMRKNGDVWTRVTIRQLPASEVQHCIS